MHFRRRQTDGRWHRSISARCIRHKNGRLFLASVDQMSGTIYDRYCIDSSIITQLFNELKIGLLKTLPYYFFIFFHSHTVIWPDLLICIDWTLERVVVLYCMQCIHVACNWLLHFHRNSVKSTDLNTSLHWYEILHNIFSWLLSKTL